MVRSSLIAVCVGGAAADWSYRVRLDQDKVGLASAVVQGGDAAFITTYSCIYDMATGGCVNATGELVSLDPSSGEERFGSRFDGAGLTGGLGKPQPPSFIHRQDGSMAAQVVGAETIQRLDDTMYYFAGTFPLAADKQTCNVPLVSGNRIAHAVDADEAACKKAGHCWDGSDDRCSLHETAQTTACNATSNPTDEETCHAQGCCFNAAFSPGWCFRASPQCYRPAPQSDEATHRPGGQWISQPAADAAGTLTSFADCVDWIGVPNDCGIGAYNSSGDRIWRFPLPAFCDSDGDSLCMCPTIAVEVPSQAVGFDAVYGVACTSSKVVLLALRSTDGSLLWRQDVADYTGDSEVEIPPTPVYLEQQQLLIVGVPDYSVAGPGKVSAYNPADGTHVWSHSIAGLGCTELSWTDSPAVAPAGDLVLFWDDFAIAALDAKTGEQRWDTKTAGFAVALSSLTPTVSGDIVVVPTVEQGRSCDAMLAESYSLTAINCQSGEVLHTMPAPAGQPPASATAPVVMGNYWIYSESDFSQGFAAHSIVHGLDAPSTVTV